MRTGWICREVRSSGPEAMAVACDPSLYRHLLYDGHFFSVEVAHNQQGRHLLIDHWPVVLYVERADGRRLAAQARARDGRAQGDGRNQAAE